MLSVHNFREPQNHASNKNLLISLSSIVSDRILSLCMSSSLDSFHKIHFCLCASIIESSCSSDNSNSFLVISL